MREIKFRGKPKMTDRNDLVYGWGCYTDENERQFIIVSPDEFIRVEKIDQLTGLKDKNGKEIYEGDIVEDMNGFREVVEWETEMELSHGLGHVHGYAFGSHSNPVEIIGNIYENPNLIKNND